MIFRAVVFPASYRGKIRIEELEPDPSANGIIEELRRHREEIKVLYRGTKRKPIGGNISRRRYWPSIRLARSRLSWPFWQVEPRL